MSSLKALLPLVMMVGSTMSDLGMDGDEMWIDRKSHPEPYKYSGNRDENMTDEELEHIRSLSKKDRKKYMKERRKLK